MTRWPFARPLTRGARALDRSRHLAAVDVRQALGRREAAVEQQHVDVVQRARAHADDDLGGLGDGIAVVVVEDLVAAAVLLEERRLHER